MKQALFILIFILLLSAPSYTAYAEEEPITSYSGTQEEYWLEQIYYQLSGLSLSIQQITINQTSANITMNNNLTAARNYYAEALALYKEIQINQEKAQETETQMSQIWKWCLAISVFQLALIVIILFAIPWGKQ